MEEDECLRTDIVSRVAECGNDKVCERSRE